MSRSISTHLFMICLPISVEPVNPSLRTSGWSDRRWPTRDPGGKRQFCRNSRPRRAVLFDSFPTWSRQDVDHSFRQPRSRCQFGKLKSCEWSHLETSTNISNFTVFWPVFERHEADLCRFENDRVPSCQAGGSFPGQHHQGIIPRNHNSTYSEEKKDQKSHHHEMM